MVEKLYKTGLIDYLKEQLNPSVIIVFGSIQKGEYDYESDVDLFIESSIKKEADLKDFEKKLKHRIQLFVYLRLRIQLSLRLTPTLWKKF